MATLTVSNQTQLETAIRNLKSGDTLLLKAGNYSDLNLTTINNQNYKFAKEVTIKSADPENRAVVNEMFLRGVHNLTITDIDFDWNGTQGADTQSWQRNNPFFIENSVGVTLDDVMIDGFRVNGFGTGTGLRVKNSTDFTLVNSDISDAKIALSIWNTTGVHIADNSFRRHDHDGLFLGGLKDAVIENNYMGDYIPQFPNAKHRDHIQFFTDAATPASENVIIRGNTMESWDTRQGVFIFNDLYRDGDRNSFHKNFLIEDNYIRTANTHGITMTHGDGVTVRGNTVVLNGDKGYSQAPLINVSLLSRDVEIIGNTVESVQDAQNAGWTVYGNTVTARSRFHWDGVYENGAVLPPKRPTGQDPSHADSYSLDAASFRPSRVLREIDFAEGDRFELTGFARDTFVGPDLDKSLTIFDRGGSVRIDSFGDLEKLVEHSPTIRMATSADGDDLYIAIGQTGSATLRLTLQDLAGLSDSLL